MKKAKPPIFPGLASQMAARGHDTRYIADVLGHSVDYIRRREKGQVEFDLRDIKALMRLYGCGFNDLFGSGNHAA